MAETEQDTVQVRFLVDQLYESEGRGRGPLFKAEKVYEMPRAHAQRWVGRNVAELVEPPPDPFPEVAKPKRGRPPKAKSEEGNGDEVDLDDDDETAPKPSETPAPPKPPEPPATPKPPEGAGPGPRFVAQPQQPAKAPDKGR